MGLFGGTCNVGDDTRSSWATKKNKSTNNSTNNHNENAKVIVGHEFATKKTKRYRFVREQATGKLRICRIRY